jgi:arylsulfatase A
MKINRALLALVALVGSAASAAPNIVYILCDDLGYGDVKANNQDGKIATPQLDRMAAKGMRFTDAHSSSAVCSPTRYGIMTGRYNWRTRLQSGVLGGLSPRLIESDRLTVAAMLKSKGYATACVGKWHLGMDWVKLPGKDVSVLSIETPQQVHNVDYTQPIANGPTAVGFDRYFGISASLDMVPYCFIENDHVVGNATETMKLVMNAKGSALSFSREGPATPGFKGEDVLPAFTKRACDIIAEHGSAKTPFFLYLPLNSPHTPILPSAEWRGKSGINLYADFVMQTDDSIGQILAALEKAGVAENTLVIVTSDNGCSPSADYPTLLAAKHNPSYSFRGHKADIFEGGHRVPFIVQWPAVVKAGSISDRTLCLTDFMATVADILQIALPVNAAEDSVSFLPTLKGVTQPAREATVHHSINGSFSIRQGQWKLELCPDSGGWSDPRPGGKKAKKAAKQPVANLDLPPTQLYDLSADIGETHNVAGEHPEIVERLTALLETYVANGRSTPGPKQANAVDPVIRK